MCLQYIIMKIMAKVNYADPVLIKWEMRRSEKALVYFRRVCRQPVYLVFCTTAYRSSIGLASLDYNAIPLTQDFRCFQYQRWDYQSNMPYLR